jgi:hypothetical protein
MTTPNTVEIYGNRYQPQVGSYLLLADRTIGECLLPGIEADPSLGWQGSQFAYPSNAGGPVKSFAVNVKLTGKTLQRRPHQEFTLYIKAEITVVGHGEPDRTLHGWLLADDRSLTQ